MYHGHHYRHQYERYINEIEEFVWPYSVEEDTSPHKRIEHNEPSEKYECAIRYGSCLCENSPANPYGNK